MLNASMMVSGSAKPKAKAAFLSSQLLLLHWSSNFTNLPKTVLLIHSKSTIMESTGKFHFVAIKSNVSSKNLVNGSKLGK